MITAKYRRPTRKRPAPPIECSLTSSAAWSPAAGGQVKLHFTLIDVEGSVVSGVFDLGSEAVCALVERLNAHLACFDSRRAERLP